MHSFFLWAWKVFEYLRAKLLFSQCVCLFDYQTLIERVNFCVYYQAYSITVSIFRNFWPFSLKFVANEISFRMNRSVKNIHLVFAKKTPDKRTWWKYSLMKSLRFDRKMKREFEFEQLKKKMNFLHIIIFGAFRKISHTKIAGREKLVEFSTLQILNGLCSA